ncbi:MAG: hypothetical protein UX99_C0016G0017 [Candidatus Amesbacteria bacterium GW2011_GWB1_47_26]|uniref:Nucleotidyl transferase AbiEii/AbiGii toxin family protein n=1 Tax=Candidatus Amesbacteria bacterium GW2011_GWC2_45_19 TaxID=1618366 RepID=A0A0G1M5D4_9BACT|nr:MAG: hypothetical protein UX05_C0002G0073 [Candidatus Amesbacteria bacterium GW2011_GWC2_45_19]KKU36805.1 MAG: hypothetical protein UX52_C0039G0004 [Candidatus Amesbacteria bacterium GW2011_GWA1_46_35]KKU68946.1 MAG: hypothetical protein UX93_C0004G0017 [Microgenomates group bacterium GW2011_GWC1_47_20]KKU74377.1 MAG: hypothetical protein UX99_C0016G0017 [Candidatus Amesbacteria bacterium GW2011_GWB1_47_26]
MIPVRPQDILHKSWLLRLLTEIADDSLLAGNIYFKGGTCAAILGYLDRFSVDLDFDLNPGADEKALRHKFHKVFDGLELDVDYENKKVLEFALKYPSRPQERNTIKVGVLNLIVTQNRYEPRHLPEIDRVMTCQTAETMFANKLVAPLDRFEKYKTIAGRDIYDIHHFFLAGMKYRPEVIEERTKMKTADYLKKLAGFITDRVTETVINQDLNTLLTADKFQKIRKVLKTETLMFIRQEITSGS